MTFCLFIGQIMYMKSRYFGLKQCSYCNILYYIGLDICTIVYFF